MVEIKLLPANPASFGDNSGKPPLLSSSDTKVIKTNITRVSDASLRKSASRNSLAAKQKESRPSAARSSLPASLNDVSAKIDNAKIDDVIRITSSPGKSSPSASIFAAQTNETEKKPRISFKARMQLAKGGEVLVGTPVKEGHVNYMLMYDMLTGIRISVSRCDAKPSRDLESLDFTAAHKLAFDATGNEMSPTSEYDFKFKDYAPYVFRRIRECFRVDSAEYLLSLTGKYVLSELGSPGKSGSFFYFSQDYRFIIKTIHRNEHDFILKILKDYHEHTQSNPHTLLSRIFGLHRVKQPGNKKIYFVVMGNVFPPSKDVHEVFDLKGSLFGRGIPEEVAISNPRAVMKDLNWIDRKKKLSFGPIKGALLSVQLEKDVKVLYLFIKFLMDRNVMDYSLLVGIHDIVKGNADNIRKRILSVYEPTAETKSTRRNTLLAQGSKSGKNGTIRKQPNDLLFLEPSNASLSDEDPPE